MNAYPLYSILGTQFLQLSDMLKKYLLTRPECLGKDCKMDGQNVSFVTLTAMVHFLNKICRPLACQGIAKAGKEEGYGV
jgi:hypothetical protein